MLDRDIVAIADKIEETKKTWFGRLKELVAIQSVSSEFDKRLQCAKALMWTCALLRKLGLKTLCHHLDKENRYVGQELPLDWESQEYLPDVLTAQLGDDQNLQTILIYGHVDVHPAKKEDGWVHDPWQMVMPGDGYIYGRGVSDGKGPLLSWFWMIDAYQRTCTPLPCNLKFIIESSHETGSENLRNLMQYLSLNFFKSVNYCVMTENYWLTRTRNCISYGLRGLLYFYVEIDGNSVSGVNDRHLHSGNHGGAIQEPMADLMALMSSLVDNQARPIIPGIYEDAECVSEVEASRIDHMDFDTQEYMNELRVPGLPTFDKSEILKRRWVRPSISIHGIEGSYDKPGAQTWMPRKVMGKFSVRIVPEQLPAKIIKYVCDHLRNVHTKRGSCNRLSIKPFYNGRALLSDMESIGYRAAITASLEVYKKPPQLIRDGGSIAIATCIEHYTNRDVVLMPLAHNLTYKHETVESIKEEHLIKGAQLFLYFLETVYSIYSVDGDIPKIDRRLNLRRDKRSKYYETVNPEIFPPYVEKKVPNCF